MMKKLPSRLVAGAALLLAIATVAGAQRPIVRVQPPDVDLVSVLPEELQGDRCVAHELNTYGQGLYLSGSGLYLSGSTGGMVRGSVTFTDPELHHPNTTLPSYTVGQVVGRAEARPLHLPADLYPFLLGRRLEADVVIVVADDFAGKFRLPPVLNTPLASQVTMAQIESMVDDGELTHGALVMHHVNAAIASLGTFEPATAAHADDRTVWVDPSTGKRLAVVGLDLTSVSGGPEISTSAVAEALGGGVRGVLDDLDAYFAAGGSWDPQGVVINMSWVFLPCATVAAFIDNKDAFDSLERYLDALGVDVAAHGIDLVMAAMNAVNDPALVRLLGVDPQRPEYPVQDFAFVAAAGNFSLPYSMLPAGWPAVVSVAVQDEGHVFPGRYSNVGDVTMPGEWVTFQPLYRLELLGEGTLLSYAGTSYAAPLVSLYAALDMASGQPQCLYQPGSPPPLTKGGTPDQRMVFAIGDC